MGGPGDDGGPLDGPEADALFAATADASSVGVAVSGGPDSTALLLLADRWARRRDPSVAVHALTVDHGLRPGSRSEAEAVGALAARLGRPHDVLAWIHDDAPPAADVQAAAREARYRLLAHAARRLRLDAVLLGHTQDDQAETLLIRLARGSGVRGLAGMAAERWVHGVRFLRPLLGVRKARLTATCAAAGVPWLEDPSNASDRFLRARIRRLMPDLAATGLTAERLAGTAARLARASRAIDGLVADLGREAATDHGGVASVAADPLRAAPEEAALRLLADLVRRVRPAAYMPRAAALEDWLAAFRRDGAPRRRTVAGVVLDLRGDRLWLYAEAGRKGFPVLPVTGAGEVIWDGRFRAVFAGDVPDGLTLRASAGVERRTDIPKAAAASLPVIDGGRPDGAVWSAVLAPLATSRPTTFDGG